MYKGLAYRKMGVAAVNGAVKGSGESRSESQQSARWCNAAKQQVVEFRV